MTGRSPRPGEAARSYGGRSLADRRADRRARFHEAGVELFGTVGFARVTISALCTEAGLSRRQFYEEFSGSEDLMTEIYDVIQQMTRERVTEAVRAADRSDLSVVAHAAIAAYIDAVATDPRLVRCLFVEVGGISETMEKHRVAGRDDWAGYIADVVASLPNSPCRTIDYRATAFIGSLIAVVHRWATSEQRPDRSEIIDLLSDMLLRLAADEETT
ncbi:TetR/AcrR family transcriptional regulator [Gordonia sp. HY285]|uniref:TetR/AcrR family transcriptional regulator n=1 Tax=Gordonia liuliyuniae TaxID=2911517 RepID=A0ABS9IP07_9ACTN|nr:TetR/AcrR family transcriptional regulator [Gordonia liuliyuniae]MCF8587282.1 TetR/AcrR family transcriptional regulator [Gordonia liuliyuniae]MCF8608850.1 TetR/AcrR family transcriptional regulator [Gordonia liuliyuniae]